MSSNIENNIISGGSYENYDSMGEEEKALVRKSIPSSFQDVDPIESRSFYGIVCKIGKTIAWVFNSMLNFLSTIFCSCFSSQAREEQTSPVLTQEQKPILTQEQKPILTQKQKPILTQEQKTILTQEQKTILTQEQKTDSSYPKDFQQGQIKYLYQTFESRIHSVFQQREENLEKKGNISQSCLNAFRCCAANIKSELMYELKKEINSKVFDEWKDQTEDILQNYVADFSIKLNKALVFCTDTCAALLESEYPEALKNYFVAYLHKTQLDIDKQTIEATLQLSQQALFENNKPAPNSKITFINQVQKIDTLEKNFPGSELYLALKLHLFSKPWLIPDSNTIVEVENGITALIDARNLTQAEKTIDENLRFILSYLRNIHRDIFVKTDKQFRAGIDLNPLQIYWLSKNRNEAFLRELSSAAENTDLFENPETQNRFLVTLEASTNSMTRTYSIKQLSALINDTLKFMRQNPNTQAEEILR